MPRPSPSADGPLPARCALLLSALRALLVSNVRYWPTVAGPTNAQLRRWRRVAEEIEDETFHALAVEKLRSEHFNAQVATTLTTLASRQLRPAAIEAIVALEVLFDYLDGVSEDLRGDQLRQAMEILRPLREAVEAAPPDTPPTTSRPDTSLTTSVPDTPPTAHPPGTPPTTSPPDTAPTTHRHTHPTTDDRRYVQALVQAIGDAIAPLPAIAAVRPSLIAAAQRCIEAQAHMHAAGSIGEDAVRDWATAAAKDGPLQWREHLAGGASSVLAMHALIVAATDEGTTPSQAAALDELYLLIGVMSTTLDSVIDRERDLGAGDASHAKRYRSASELSEALVSVCRLVLQRAGKVPNAAHHIVTLTGVLAYYLSSPKARDPYAEAVADGLRKPLSPLLGPPTLVLRCWRLGKALSRRSFGIARRRARKSALSDGQVPASDGQVSAVEGQRREG